MMGPKQAAKIIIIDMEGGEEVVNDRHDPGGETKYGISKNAYPHLDIPNLTYKDAETIFTMDYWSPSKCDKLPFPLNLYVADSAFNQGVATAVTMLQEALRVTPDGKIGPITLAAVERADILELAAVFMGKRSLKYTRTRKFGRFGEGWFNRQFRLAHHVAIHYLKYGC